MKCPVCEDVRMREVMKDDVLIDVCPDCKGVWLDRGELEKLLQGIREVRTDYDRMEQQSVSYSDNNRQAPPPNWESSNHRSDYDRDKVKYDSHGYDKHGYNKHGYDKHGRPYKKKKTVLDIFDNLFD